MVRWLFHRAKMNFTSTRVLIYALILLIPLGNIGLAAPGDHLYYLPVIDKYTEYSGSPTDWPQLGHDAQRTNASPAQINPPYCYAWKWDAVPIASRLQPVVSAGRLFVGGMDGVLYARNASSGAPLWHFTSSGPIRNSAAVAGTRVIFSSYDGFTYALNVSDGALVWRTQTGSSATAPLIDSEHQLVFVASTNGTLSAISLLDGAAQWTYDSGAAILTSPALSGDNRLVYFGNEA
ncbi:MAG TPA: PQQ-binding-like beta-propeller repeat protein, partial [Pseudomonadales bacterium]|nr:PQQ-binding-like beta-propeller repeat protein [Pseudomonadales bacterium]